MNDITTAVVCFHQCILPPTFVSSFILSAPRLAKESRSCRGADGKEPVYVYADEEEWCPLLVRQKIPSFGVNIARFLAIGHTRKTCLHLTVEHDAENCTVCINRNKRKKKKDIVEYIFAGNLSFKAKQLHPKCLLGRR